MLRRILAPQRRQRRSLRLHRSRGSRFKARCSSFCDRARFAPCFFALLTWTTRCCYCFKSICAMLSVPSSVSVGPLTRAAVARASDAKKGVQTGFLKNARSSQSKAASDMNVEAKDCFAFGRFPVNSDRHEMCNLIKEHCHEHLTEFDLQVWDGHNLWNTTKHFAPLALSFLPLNLTLSTIHFSSCEMFSGHTNASFLCCLSQIHKCSACQAFQFVCHRRSRTCLRF